MIASGEWRLPGSEFHEGLALVGTSPPTLALLLYRARLLPARLSRRGCDQLSSGGVSRCLVQVAVCSSRASGARGW